MMFVHRPSYSRITVSRNEIGFKGKGKALIEQLDTPPKHLEHPTYLTGREFGFEKAECRNRNNNNTTAKREQRKQKHTGYIRTRGESNRWIGSSALRWLGSARGRNSDS